MVAGYAIRTRTPPFDRLASVRCERGPASHRPLVPTVEHTTFRPTGRCATGCIRLSADLRRRFSLGDSGCYNPASRLSGGGASPHVAGEAIDLTCNWHDPAQRARGDACFEFLVAHADETNLQQVIWGPRIFTASRGVHAYTGSDHYNHLHVAPGHNAALNWNGWGEVTSPPVPSGDAELNETERHQLDRIELMAASASINGTKIPPTSWYAADASAEAHKISERLDNLERQLAKVVKLLTPAPAVTTEPLAPGELAA